MKKNTFVLICYLVFLTHAIAQSERLDTLLFELPDISFEKIETPENYQAAYVLKVKQPIDHFDHSKGYFHQKVYLSHAGFNKPSVIITQGYSRSKNSIFELSQLLKANQIDVEHRYFGESAPNEMDYRYLNLKQATADLHHIRSLLGTIYQKKWVSTGVSKGGSTTIFYRYFYPNDVDVSVPYVAPINNAFEDKRIYKFFDTIGTSTCRRKIENFQKQVLKQRKKILPLLEFYNLGKNNKFGYVSEEEAFELAVLEYPFSFWQWGTGCEDIPADGASIAEKTKHLIKVSDISFFSNQSMEEYGSHYFQAAEEMGYYGYETEDFKNLLKALPKNENPHAAFTPHKMNVEFTGQELLNDVAKWLQTKGDRFIHIYGGNDTWSATGVPKSNEVDSQWFVLKDIHHGNARLKNFSKAQRQRLLQTLNNWLELDLK